MVFRSLISCRRGWVDRIAAAVYMTLKITEYPTLKGLGMLWVASLGLLFESSLVFLSLLSTLICRVTVRDLVYWLPSLSR